MNSRLARQVTVIACLIALLCPSSKAIQQREKSDGNAADTASQLMKAGNYAAAETVLLNARERLKESHEAEAIPVIEVHLANCNGPQKLDTPLLNE